MGENTSKAMVPSEAIPAGMAVTDGFGSREIAVGAETQGGVLAERSRAEIEARCVMALRRPRDLDTVRERMMKECARPGFAEVARYSKPVGGGKKAEGFSIRFAEAAARSMTNIAIDVETVYDDLGKRIVSVAVVDLEANYPIRTMITLDKTVERKSIKPGQEVLSSRTNSQGEQTFLVRATEDDLAVKQGAAVSKAMRNCILRLIPGDILDDCEERILHTQHTKDAQDPAAARKKIADGFGMIGVKAAELKAYLGHDLDGCSPAEMKHLREVYQAIKDGETTWRAVLGDKETAANDGKPAPSSVSDKIKAKAGKPAVVVAAPDEGPSEEERAAIAAREREEAGLPR